MSRLCLQQTNNCWPPLRALCNTAILRTLISGLPLLLVSKMERLSLVGIRKMPLILCASVRSPLRWPQRPVSGQECRWSQWRSPLNLVPSHWTNPPARAVPAASNYTNTKPASSKKCALSSAENRAPSSSSRLPGTFSPSVFPANCSKELRPPGLPCQ